LHAQRVDVPASAAEAAVAEIQAEKVGVCCVIQRSPMTSRASRLRPTGLRFCGSAVAIAPVADRTNGNAADKCVLSVKNAPAGKK